MINEDNIDGNVETSSQTVEICVAQDGVEELHCSEQGLYHMLISAPRK